MTPTLLLLIVVCLGALPLRAQPPVDRTSIRVITPYHAVELSPDVTLLAEFGGTCFSPALTTPWRPDAWRCTAEDGLLYDPCFTGPAGAAEALACIETPWAGGVALLLLDEPLPESDDSALSTLADALP